MFTDFKLHREGKWILFLRRICLMNNNAESCWYYSLQDSALFLYVDSKMNSTQLNLIELSCEFLFSICLLLCLCSLLLQSCLLLSILLWGFLNGSWLLCLGVLFCCYMGVLLYA